MAEINISTGIISVSVNGKREIKFNPTDSGFIDTLCAMIEKVEAITKKCDAKIKDSKDSGKHLDFYRARDKQMVEAIDSVFGDGFWNDSFDYVRPIAFNGDGLMLIEDFAYSLLDLMDENVVANTEKHNAKIEAYTEKYKNRRKAKKPDGT